jgi:hypothetical protein
MSQQAQATSKQPAFIIWYVPEGENTPWTRIGAMWPTKSGKGFTHTMEFIPTGKGHIVSLPNEPKETKDKGEGA